MVRFLPDAVVLAIHDDQIRLYGGSYGVRDEGALAAALALPRAQFGGQYLHTTIAELAAAYAFHLCEDHSFVDGNKRTAGMTMFTFLSLNGLDVVAPEQAYYETMMAVATHTLRKAGLAAWLRTVVRGTPPDVRQPRAEA